MAGKQYEIARFHRRTDPKTGDDTLYEVGEPYSGPLDKPYLLAPGGPDGKGPLIVEKPTTPTSSDSGVKEK